MVKGNITFEGCRIIFRNFEGKEARFNPAGNRNFCVVIEDDELARRLIEDGWNVKMTRPRDDGDRGTYYIQVSVSFDYMPPKIVMITSAGKNEITEDNVAILDYADLANVDLIIRPYNWEVNGKTGVKAYLKTMYVTLEEDDLEKKYAYYEDDETLPFE